MLAGLCVPVIPRNDPTTAEASGDHFDIRLKTFEGGETLIQDADALFEEVAAVVEGEFHVQAAGDEAYTLVAGEGIIIPPREPRAWVCTSEAGMLYRVLVRSPGVA